MKNKKIIRIALPVLLAVVLIPAAFYVVRGLTPVDMGADYTETTEYIAYPGQGFYEFVYPTLSNTEPACKYLEANLIAMRIGIGTFSDNYRIKKGGQGTANAWEPLSQEFLDMLESELEICRENKTPVILRFAYDNFRGWGDCEPSMDGIISHIGQLAPLFQEYKDVIYCVESGLLGPFGEQHTSAIINQENMNTLLDALLAATDESTQISVRRPAYFAGYVGITEEELADYRAPADSPYYRIGIFNDGYLGNATDCGTFADRDNYNSWISYQGGHTMYGSEATVPDGDDVDWTYVDNICEEMFITHTSYLNTYFNQRVFDRWQSTAYTGSDQAYSGLTVYDYVKNHMGYRYVLRSAEYTQLFGRLTIHLGIENVGAGNALRQAEVKLTAVDDNGTRREFTVNTDIRDWTSETVTDLDIPVDLSGLSGTCSFYLQITDGLGNVLQLANQNMEFNEETGCLCGSISA